MPNRPKILILSSDTGGGHRSAAQALSDGIHRFWEGGSIAVRVIKAVEDSHHITQKMVGVYNWVLRNKQHWMKYLHWTINLVRPETRAYFHRRCLPFFHALFDRWCPHVVVSVHPLTQHILAKVLKELNLEKQVPLVTVVTDPASGLWRGWACDDVTLYLVANDEVRMNLMEYGIASEKIKISGMPVHPKFREVNEHDAQAARHALDLNPNKFTVFVNAGWIGGGNIPQIFRELVRGELDVQAIFLAGKNDDLKREAELLAKTAKFPVKVIGYSDDVERLMHAANVMISKLGGLTTFEALACRLPIIADTTTPPMPQEAGTASLLAQRGAGILLKKCSDIVPTIESLLDDSAKYAAMRAATIGLAIPNSTQRIVAEITALLPQNLDEISTPMTSAAS